MNHITNNGLTPEINLERSNLLITIDYCRPEDLDKLENVVARAYERFPEIHQEMEDALTRRKLELSIVTRSIRDIETAGSFGTAKEIMERVWRQVESGDLKRWDAFLISSRSREELTNKETA